MKWVLVSQSIGEGYVAEMGNMVATFHEYNPDVAAITRAMHGDGCEWQTRSNGKVQWLIDVFGITDCDLLWVDADARFRRKVELPQGDFVVAAQDYSSNQLRRLRQPQSRVGSRVSTGTMLIRRCPGTLSLLQGWLAATEDIGNNEVGLAEVLHKVPTSFYCELPRTFSSVCSLRPHWKGRLEYDSAIVHWNRSRMVVGTKAKDGQTNKETDWPPPEHVRMAATT